MILKALTETFQNQVSLLDLEQVVKNVRSIYNLSLHGGSTRKLELVPRGATRQLHYLHRTVQVRAPRGASVCQPLSHVPIWPTRRPGRSILLSFTCLGGGAGAPGRLTRRSRRGLLPPKPLIDASTRVFTGLRYKTRRRV